jgi:hypothetical protein
MDGHSARPERRPVELSGHGLLADGASIAVTLVDLSYEGCRIRTEDALQPGDRLKLSVFNRGLIEAEVRWSEAGHAGLSFGTYEVPTRPEWPRRSERVPLTADVSLRRPGQPSFQVRLFDASPEGCKIDSAGRAREGDKIWVKFEGLETIEAAVCWVKQSVMGVNFTRPMHPAVFDLLVERLTQGGA